jgi:hypothetical protein
MLALPKILSVITVLTGVLSSSGFGAVIASTSFGGSAAAPTGDTGFSSTIWASTAGGATASSATFTPGDIPATIPTAYTSTGFTNTGNYLTTQASPAFRTLSSSISNETSSTTYFSFLYRVNTEVAGNGGGLSFFNGATELFQFGYGGGNQIRIAPVGATQVNTSGTYVAGSTLFMVGKIQSGVGADTLSIRFFQGSEALETTDAAVFSGTQFATINHPIPSAIDTIRFNSPASPASTQSFDEFRMGSSLADVTAVPEPSTFATVAFGLAGMLGMRRARNRQRI